MKNKFGQIHCIFIKKIIIFNSLNSKSSKMNKFSIFAFVFMAFLTVIIASPAVIEKQMLVAKSNSSPSLMQVLMGGGKMAATCFDLKLASFINAGLKSSSNNMGKLANYILDQIKAAHYSGYWLVHAQMIGGQQYPVRWDSKATGDIFQPSSRHGCYYHDGQIYIIIIQY